jgi:hypothetical protein
MNTPTPLELYFEDLREENALLRIVLLVLLCEADEEELQQVEARGPEIQFSVLRSREAIELLNQFGRLPRAQQTDAASWTLIVDLVCLRVEQISQIYDRLREILHVL